MSNGAQPQQKKGFSPMAWVLIGCVGLIVVFAIVIFAGGLFVTKKAADFIEENKDNPTKAIAEMAVKMNPDLDYIESDDETVTFENEKGQVVTMSFKDIEEGKFSFETEGGEGGSISFGPDGISGTGTGEDGEETDFAVFGGADTSNVPEEVKFPEADDFGATMTQRSDSQASGMITYTTDASMEEVIEWQAGSLGECKVNQVDYSGNQIANLDCGPNSATLQFSDQYGKLRVSTTYEIRERQ
jgi:hypothetical protein